MGEISVNHLLDRFETGCYITNRDRVITHWNKAAEQISGFSAQEVIGKCCSSNILMHVDHDGELLCKEGTCPLAHSIENCDCHQGHVYMHHKEGHRVPVRVETSPNYNEAGEVIGGIEIFWDISHQLKVQHPTELEQMAYSDPLIDIPNRRYMDNQFKLIEKHDQLDQYVIALFDIDHFKKINDRYGHHTGDLVLKAVGKTLLHNLRPDDQVARWGGEEFIVLLKDVNIEQANLICDRLRRLVKNAHVRFDNNSVRVSISGGLYQAKMGDTVEMALHFADQHLYQAKNNGRDQIAYEMATA